MMLHTLNATPDSAAFSECLRLLGATDALLLLGDGVYAALADTPASTALTNCGAAVFVLQADAEAAGVSPRQSPDITTADFEHFVTLTEQFSKQQAWY